MKRKEENFPLCCRITTASEYSSIKRQGRSIRSRSFLASFLSGSRKKIGIVATRKAGPATERNRVKRLIREYFRRNKGDFPQGSVVFVVGNAAAVRDNEELREELSAVVKRLRDKAENDGGRR